MMEYNAHKYQNYATDFILANPIAAIFLDCGLGKTVITLTAIEELLHDRFEVERVLIIAPLRVARDTWSAEIEKWEHLNGLTYSVIIGTEKELEGYDEEFLKQECEKILLGRYGQPEEVAELIAFLVSDKATYINNTVIRIDGGQLGSC